MIVKLANGVSLRHAEESDALEIAELFSLVYGGGVDGVTSSLQKEINRASLGLIQRQVFVAVKERRDIGYGRSGRLDREAIKDSRGMVAGWFLLGLVVHPAERRCGVGHALTDLRLKKLRKLTRTVYYFAAKDNLASIALHEKFGFCLMTTDFHHPNSTFSDGSGLLFRQIST